MAKQAAIGVLVAIGMLAAGAAGAHGSHDGMSMDSSMDMGSGHASMSQEAGAHGASSLKVSGCWIRALPEPAPSAGYFVVQNTSEKEVRLKSASSPDFGMAMLHESMESDGMSKMKMVHDIPVPAGGTLEFKPGGYHVMLEKPKHELKVGSSLELDLAFDSGAVAKTSCAIKPADTISG